MLITFYLFVVASVVAFQCFVSGLPGCCVKPLFRVLCVLHARQAMGLELELEAFQLFRDLRLERLAHVLNRNAGDDLGEESVDDELAGDSLWDATAHQVEQLFVIEPADRSGVAGTDNAAGFDLQVRHGICTRTLGKDEVAVSLIRVSALSVVANELPMEYALELNRLIELQMEGSVG